MRAQYQRPRHRRCRQLAVGLVQLTVTLALCPGSWTADRSKPAGQAGAIAFIGGFIEEDESAGGDQVYTVRPDGTERTRVTRDGDEGKFALAVSPDGRQVAYTSTGQGEVAQLYVVGADGRGRHRITRGSLSVGSMSWSPDGSALVFDVELRDPIGYTLERINADGSGRRRLFNDRRNRYSPAWSPGGGLIAYLGPRGIYTSRPDGTNERLVFADRGVRGLEWLANGRGLVVTRRGRVQIVSLAGKPGRVLFTRSPDGVTVSPDLTKIAFIAEVVVINNVFTHLFVVPTGGSEAVDLMPDEQATINDADWQDLCTIYGTGRADTIRGTRRADKICGLGGNDVIRGGGGNDIILGGAGNDRLYGGGGSDWLFAGIGDDVLLSADGAREITDGGPGRDTATADPRETRDVECLSKPASP